MSKASAAIMSQVEGLLEQFMSDPDEAGKSEAQQMLRSVRDLLPTLREGGEEGEVEPEGEGAELAPRETERPTGPREGPPEGGFRDFKEAGTAALGELRRRNQARVEEEEPPEEGAEEEERRRRRKKAKAPA